MPNTTDVDIRSARMPDEIATVRQLFTEYAQSLEVDLGFQNFSTELARLPGAYAPPKGDLLIARDASGAALGCVAMRPLDMAGTCEMKRLFVRTEARGRDLGRHLATAIIERARDAGHNRMVLDTLHFMQAAQRLYATLGFREIAPYYDNPLKDVRFLALDL